MAFAPDTVMTLEAAVTLANSDLTADARAPRDTLTTRADLAAFVERFAYTGVVAGTEDELAQVRALRPGLRRVLRADRDHAVEIVNDWLREVAAVPQLVRHDHEDWHIHTVASDEPLARRILAETAMAMIDLIRADEMSRLSRCAADGCDGIVLDLSRNRSRRFCSATCGNRAAQSAHRARRRARDGAGHRP